MPPSAWDIHVIQNKKNLENPSALSKQLVPTPGVLLLKNYFSHQMQRKKIASSFGSNQP